MKTIEIIVSGRVQGVYFRAFVKKIADKYDITGFARNKPDGRVEIIATGKQEKLDPFITSCHKGPLLAKVSQIQINNSSTIKTFSQFDIC